MSNRRSLLVAIVPLIFVPSFIGFAARNTRHVTPVTAEQQKPVLPSLGMLNKDDLIIEGSNVWKVVENYPDQGLLIAKRRDLTGYITSQYRYNRRYNYFNSHFKAGTYFLRKDTPEWVKKHCEIF